LRAVEVSRLRLDDLDWRTGQINIDGKAHRRDQLPLPSDVGEAIVEHLKLRGQRRGQRHVFVGQAAAVVDDRVHELPSHAARTLGAVAGQRVAGRLEAPEALGVHVQQMARARPLVAHDRRALRRLAARAAAAAQDLVDGRVRPADLVGDPPR
jgi:integrase/recombinase XerD